MGLTILTQYPLTALQANDPALPSAMDLLERMESRGTRNPLVPEGLRGADVLGLRATENSHIVTMRERGSQEERKQRLVNTLNMRDAEGLELELDDSWEDETGFVRSKAKKFMNTGLHSHDPTKPPPGKSVRTSQLIHQTDLTWVMLSMF